MSDPLLYEKDGHIVVLTMNRPETRNPISEAGMVDALVDALARISADPEIRCAILTGAGSAFSSGGDLRKMHEGMERRRTEPTKTPGYYTLGIQRIPLAFQKLDVPIIAAVNGPAIGAGCDLTCMCDIRIAGESARFAESFAKIGLIPGDGGAYLLPRVVGFSKAAEMAFTGDQVNATDALACGLVSKVVPDAELMTAAKELAMRIAANPPLAVRATKRLMMQGRDMTLPAILEMSAAMQALAHTTADHREAVTAFLEKRKPVFTGR